MIHSKGRKGKQRVSKRVLVKYGKFSWNDLRSIAKEKGIIIFRKTRAEIEQELNNA